MQVAQLRKKDVITLSEIEYYLKQVYEGKASTSRIRVEGRVYGSGAQYTKRGRRGIEYADNQITLQRRIMIDGVVILDWKNITY